MTGTVVRVVRDKGFAFLRDEEGMSRFAHAKDFVPVGFFDTVQEQQTVQFDPAKGSRGNGLRAEQVRPCSS
jgi:cold shock CspA family protein